MPRSSSSSFDLLHERVRRWVWEQQWSELRDVQEQSIRLVLQDSRDVIISAATAGGKTEAAFLPICSSLLSRDLNSGVDVLYVGPLKALINDQWRRLDELCDAMEIPVHRWHGDVNASAKQRLTKEPDGILLITPESLEALFVRRGADVVRIFAGLQFVVIDELHAFIGTERGIQLMSLLHRLEAVLRRKVRRIGLSATLGDMQVAREFLRGRRPEDAEPAVVTSTDGGPGLKLRLFGFRNDDSNVSEDDDEPAVESGESAVAAHLFKHLRGANNLVFANSRGAVESFADRLRRMCDASRLPQEFFAHHGSLSRELRFDAEAQLKRGDMPITVVCTSTLEMGIDIGAVKSVAQIGPPPTVASLRQRLGRSGRRGEPSVLRLYAIEDAVTDRSSVQDAIRTRLVLMIAMVNLMLRHWIEPPRDELVHASTLVQQVLSVIAQYGGMAAGDLFSLLCRTGPFGKLAPDDFARLLRNFADLDLIAQMSDGTLIHGGEGERLVNKYDFYAVFHSSVEYRLVTGGKPLGTLPIETPLVEGSFLIFAGRRWVVTSVDARIRVIDVSPAAGGRVPLFDARGAGEVSDEVRQEMRSLYLSDEVPVYLDMPAAELLAEGRENFHRLGLRETSVITSGASAVCFPWYGDRRLNTLVQVLLSRGHRASAEGPAVGVIGVTPEELNRLVVEIEGETIDTEVLASAVLNRDEEKWDWALDTVTSCRAYASRHLVIRVGPQ